MIARVKCSACGAIVRSGNPSDTCPGAEGEPCGASLREAEAIERVAFSSKVNYSNLPYVEWIALSEQKRRALYGAALARDPRLVALDRKGRAE